MELKKMIFKFAVGLAVLTTVYTSSCKSTASDEGLYCINCLPEEPDSGKISIKITLNNENRKIPVTVFKSRFNPSVLMDTVFSDTINISAFTINVEMNKFYSVKATYKSDSKIIHAIDGGWFEAKELTGCQNICWQTIGGTYDLQLKE